MQSIFITFFLHFAALFINRGRNPHFNVKIEKSISKLYYICKIEN